MPKSIKLKNNTYLDARGITYNRKTLQEQLDFMDIKILNHVIEVEISANSNTYRTLTEGKTYKAVVDLKDILPNNIVAILPSQGYYLQNGSDRCIAMPSFDYPFSMLEIYAPRTGTFIVRVLALYK